MISPNLEISLKNARKSFQPRLAAGDDCSQKAAVAGEGFGDGTARLNFAQTVRESALLALREANGFWDRKATDRPSEFDSAGNGK